MKIITILFCATILVITSTQYVEIQDLTHNPGILALYLGETKIIQGYHNLVHTVNITELSELIINLEKIIKTNKMIGEKKSIETIIDMKFKHIMESFNSIKPNYRTKRALANILGSAIKIITGNLDEDDGKEIKNAIDTLRDNNKNLIKQNNLQVSINNEIGEKIQDLIKLVNKHENEIKNEIGYTKTNYIELIYNMELVQKQLDTIIDSMHLAKAGVITRALLGNNELDLIYNALLEQKLKIISKEQVFDLCKIQIFYHNDELIFNVKIPKLLENKFKYIRLEALPTNSGKTMIIHHKYAIVSNEQLFYTSKSCNAMFNIKICEKEQMATIPNDTCFGNILRGQIGNCTYQHDDGIPTIEQIQPQYIITKNLPEVNISTDCTNDTKQIKGCQLIHFSNCTIKINDTEFMNLKSDVQPKVIPMITIQAIQSKFTEKNATMELSNLYIKNREKITEIISSSAWHVTITYTTLLCIVAIGSIAIILLIYYVKRGKQQFLTTIATEKSPVDKLQMYMITPRGAPKGD